ncbi:hypothetical protein [Ramlibacter cellulosilyticus]|uniref:hypothetical protein n=1 Tax=Ramlibacter cellulosilyticus TaxID=2764187 RepID=UPI002103E576|nr:hypothetical protein [Ramlibacter cellulosilyticus]
MPASMPPAGCRAAWACVRSWMAASRCARGVVLALRAVQREPGAVQARPGQEAFARQLLGAVQLQLGVVDGDARAPDLRLRAGHERGRHQHARAGLPARALVDHGRHHGHEQRHRLAGPHGIALPQRDAGEPRSDRRGHGITVLQPGLPVLLDGLFEAAEARHGSLDRHGPRREGPGHHRGDREDGGARPQVLPADVAEHVHSLVLRAATRSRRSMRRRTTSALPMPAAMTHSAAQA